MKLTLLRVAFNSCKAIVGGGIKSIECVFKCEVCYCCNSNSVGTTVYDQVHLPFSIENTIWYVDGGNVGSRWLQRYTVQTWIQESWSSSFMKNVRDSSYYKNNSDCTCMCGCCVVLQVWMIKMLNLTYESESGRKLPQNNVVYFVYPCSYLPKRRGCLKDAVYTNSEACI